MCLQFENGSTAEICTSVVFDAPRRMEVYGSEGHALCEDTLGPDGDGRIVTHDGELAYEVTERLPFSTSYTARVPSGISPPEYLPLRTPWAKGL